MRRAKIVGTIGPASDSPEVLRKLIAAGLDVARLNFSHGSHEQHARTIAAIRDAAASAGRPIAILQDLQGPRIRIGTLDAPVSVESGQTITLTTDSQASGGAIPVTYGNLPDDVKPGDRILIDDGLIELAVEEAGKKAIRCRVVTGGTIRPHKGMNLPGVAVSAPAFGEKDRADLSFGLSHGVDYVGLSFVRGPEDVMAARAWMKRYDAEAAIIAKIERPEAVERLDAIVAVADGVMIARGDLAVETSPEAVPLIQKRIIRLCNERRVIVITATQMLESMTASPRPTRAEASDVANAVLDGTDAVMLSGETASGRYPVEAVETMARIVVAAEQGQEQAPVPAQAPSPAPFPAAVCAAGARAARETSAKVVVAFTESGTTARLLSKERPAVPIVAYTPHDAVRRRMALYWGVLPRAMRPIPNTDELIRELERSLREEKLAGSNDRIVILLGAPAGTRGGTNLMKLHRIT
ncbi:MAG: pyruvate kinase [Nitrospiraceae bacterium]|nr:MAG: pyruvate kinase [Nitrospiraceae bacterium]